MQTSNNKIMAKSFIITNGSESSSEAIISTAASTLLPPSEKLSMSTKNYALNQDVDDSDNDTTVDDSETVSDRDLSYSGSGSSEDDDEEWNNEWDFWILEAKRVKAEAGGCDNALVKSDPKNLTATEEEANDEEVIGIEICVIGDCQEYAEEVVKAVQDSDDDDSESEVDDEWDSWILEAKRLKAEAERNWYWYPEDVVIPEEDSEEERAIDIEQKDCQKNAEEVVTAVPDNDDSEGDDEWDFWIQEAIRWKAEKRNWSMLQLVA